MVFPVFPPFPGQLLKFPRVSIRGLWMGTSVPMSSLGVRRHESRNPWGEVPAELEVFKVCSLVNG